MKFGRVLCIPVKENVKKAADFLSLVNLGLACFLVGDFLLFVGKPFAIFPCDQIAFESMGLAPMDSQVPDNGGLMEVRIFFEDKLE